MPPGSIVVIDTEDKDPEGLIDAIVAARDWNALKLFWLQKHKDSYRLVPERVTSENPVWEFRVLESLNSGTCHPVDCVAS
jgi:hypothetical protein